MNTEEALRLLFMGLTVMTEAAATVEKINAAINKARAEGRDITDSELAVLAGTTSIEHQKTLDALNKVINGEGA